MVRSLIKMAYSSVSTFTTHSIYVTVLNKANSVHNIHVCIHVGMSTRQLQKDNKVMIFFCCKHVHKMQDRQKTIEM